MFEFIAVSLGNPMHAIPSFFNHIYEMKNHLRVHSQRAPVEAWIEWRDRLAAGQIRKYAEFVNYWMERFETLNDNRIFISYERLTDDVRGPEEAARITKFLAQREGVDPISVNSVPCVWRAVVKYKEVAANPNKRRLGEGRRRLDPAHHDSQRSGPTERPYTPQLLASMSQMLLDLIERWGDHHLRLRITLEGYQKDIHEAYLMASGKTQQLSADNTGISPFNSIPGISGDAMVDTSAPRKAFHIFQASLPHTGSAVLTNFLMGLFEPDADYAFMENLPDLPVRQRGLMVPVLSTIVTKTNIVDLLVLYKKFRPEFEEVFFVVSNRGKFVKCWYSP